MDIRFDGRTAIVTGAGSGIGAAIARDLGAAGATVIASDIDADSAAAVAAEITGAGGSAHATATDVSDPDAVAALVAFAVERTGALHLLVNNAGIAGPAAALGDYPLDGWQRVIDVNLNGPFYGMRFALPEIEKAGGGAIVNIASILGTVAFANAPAYVTAKHGLVGMTRAAAIDYAPRNIRVNAVGPAFIKTPLLDALDADTMAALAGMHPIGRLGTSEEVSALVLFLLSDQAAFITGSYHLVDGAYTAQ